jgi:poly(A) polymerase
MNMDLDIRLKFNSHELEKVLAALSVDGEEVRIVGGAVRDTILGQTPKDIDLITTLHPKEVVKLLREARIDVIPTGIKFGTVTAYIEGVSFEITTLREDIECDGRRAKVCFTKDFAKDAARRDFTINAMSYDSCNNKLYDYFNGYEDLQNKIVRFIGNPVQRIQEDHLRILRFFRFSAKYASKLDEKGLLACTEQRERIKFLSPERIISELNKILGSDGFGQILEIMQQNQLLSEISQDLQWDIDSYNIFIKELPKIFAHNISKLELHYITLLNKNSWDILQSELFRLRLSNREIRKIYYLKYYHDMLIQGVDLNYLIKLLVCDHKAELSSFLTYISAISAIPESQAVKLLEKYQIYIGKELPISGEDLKRRFNGIEIGDQLKKAKDIWIDSDFAISREELLDKILR